MGQDISLPFLRSDEPTAYRLPLSCAAVAIGLTAQAFAWVEFTHGCLAFLPAPSGSLFCAHSHLTQRTGLLIHRLTTSGASLHVLMMVDKGSCLKNHMIEVIVLFIRELKKQLYQVIQKGRLAITNHLALSWMVSEALNCNAILTSGTGLLHETQTVGSSFFFVHVP